MTTSSTSPDTTVPDDADAAAINALAARIEAEDGAPPLSDQALTRLRSGAVRHVLVRAADGSLLGYGQVDGADLEVVGDPDAARSVLGAVTGPVRVWTHGRRSRLVQVFESLGLRRARELFQLRRPADAPLPVDPPLADGMTVRPFEVDRDEQAWLQVNAAAFAHHPEQGRQTLDDLRAREDADWFDPEGFLLAERDGELLGFHWTKIHPDGGGEVYVLGIAPAAQGLGLGGALLIRGLRHLHSRGVPYVLLYVDGDNEGALHLYRRDLFTEHDVDVQWERP